MAAPPSKKHRTEAKDTTAELSETLLPSALQYAMVKGIIMAGTKDQCKEDPTLVTHCPFSLLPFKVPAKAFQEAVQLSPLWNRLVDAVARDTNWLYKTLEHTARADPFVERLVKICRSVHAQGGPRQKKYLGMHRSDYMLHEPEGCSAADVRFLQVELNTIASSFGALSSRVADMHSYLLQRYGEGSDKVAMALQEQFAGVDHTGDIASPSRLPGNETLKGLPLALAEAHKAYGVKEAVVVVVVQVGERNFADQQWLVYALWENHKVPVVRKSLGEIRAECTMDKDSGRLRLANGQEISVAYYRSGYGLDDYISEAEWEARSMLEESLVIKCPSVAYQLVGTKKVQQALARPGAMELFMDAEDSKRLRRCFAGLWGLGPGEDDEGIVSKATSKPAGFVMKPQREGGGHNFYGDDIAKKLTQMSTDERGAYILMERILPRAQQAIFARAGEALVTPAMAEFGFYSVFLGDGGAPILNQHAGHLVRSKPDGVDEGGVAAGYAVISSPFLS